MSSVVKASGTRSRRLNKENETTRSAEPDPEPRTPEDLQIIRDSALFLFWPAVGIWVFSQWRSGSFTDVCRIRAMTGKPGAARCTKAKLACVE
jgi:hypothetical protein